MEGLVIKNGASTRRPPYRYEDGVESYSFKNPRTIMVQGESNLVVDSIPRIGISAGLIHVDGRPMHPHDNDLFTVEGVTQIVHRPDRGSFGMIDLYTIFD